MRKKRNLLSELEINAAYTNDFTADSNRIKRMVNDSLNSVTEERTMYMKQKLCRMVLAAAVILAVSATGVFAAGFILDSGFVRYFNPASDVEMKFLSSSAYTVNQTDSNSSGTLTVKQVVGDERNLFILMDFAAPDAVLDYARYRFDVTSHIIDDFDANTSIGYRLISDENPNDDKITLVCCLSFDRSGIKRGSKMSLTLRDLEAASEYPSPFKTVVTGEWRVTFALDYGADFPKLTAEADIPIFGRNSHERLYVSPMAVNITVTGFDARSDEYQKMSNEEQSSFILNYKDGQSEYYSFDSGIRHGVGGSADGTGLTFTWVFDNLIDVKNVKSITYLGHEFALTD